MHTNSWALLRVVFGVLLASAPLSAQAPRQDPSPQVAGERAIAILEQAGKWVELCNGRDLEGWHGDANGYEVADGRLVCKKGGKNLYTNAEFTDFAFRFEFKLEESGNNGIGVRVPDGGHPSRDGLEIQILDHHGSKYQVVGENGRRASWLKPWQFHGSIYGVHPAKTGHLRPVGEWNSETIIAIDEHILVILNGAVIVDAFLEGSHALDGHPHPGVHSRKGHLVLAGHNDRVEFRRLQVMDLSPPPPSLQTKSNNEPPPGFTALFDGASLDGWKGLSHQNANQRRALQGDALARAQAQADDKMRRHWTADDGVLTYDGQGASLCTARDYGDFDLYVDWKIPPGADSGIYLRGTPQIQIWDPWDFRRDKAPTDAKDWVALYANGRNLGSGGLWNNRRSRNSPTRLADHPPGQWNTFLIRMVGERVSVWLNGQNVVDRVQLENYWDKSGRSSLPRADQIELQHHGSQLFFRNLFIRELPY